MFKKSLFALSLVFVLTSCNGVAPEITIFGLWEEVSVEFDGETEDSSDGRRAFMCLKSTGQGILRFTEDESIETFGFSQEENDIVPSEDSPFGSAGETRLRMEVTTDTLSVSVIHEEEVSFKVNFRRATEQEAIEADAEIDCPQE